MTNTNMRKGFTMIELIFVIVIIGILAAVAIPKLAATRDDAKASKAAHNLATFITDLGSAYTAKGTMATTDTNVKLGDDGCFIATLGAATDGNMTIEDNGTSAGCVRAHAIAFRGNNSAPTPGKVHSFRGTGVTY